MTTHQEIYAITSRIIHQNINKQIKGDVKVTFKDELLIVDIYHKQNNIFRYTQKIKKEDLVYGICTTQLTDIIINKYKKHILRIYFV